MNTGERVGPYELRRRIGEGGMGVVWEAHDSRLGRGVALKFLPESVADDVESRARFEREARAASALTHPNICVIYDVGEHGARPYLVMELLAGQTLSDRLAEGPLDERDLVRLGRHLAAALGAAHDQGILHRDLKPANVFLTPEGNAKVLDFGVAKALSSDPEDRTELTSEGTLLGTVKYMSPEQALGKELDGRSDLFSLGAVLHAAATSSAPFGESSVGATLNAVINAPAPDLKAAAPLLSEGIVELVERLMQKDPARRFSSAAHLADALDRLRAALPGQTASGIQPAAAPAPAAAPSIAVLPFANLSADPDSEFFTDGLAEELITSLSRLSGLRVAARSSSFQFKEQAIDACAAGKTLGVGTVLEGSVRRAGERVRVTAQLVDVDTGYQKWSERFDGTLDDIFQIQEDTAAAIVKGLEVELGTSGPQRLVTQHTSSREAYELYLKGRFHWARRHKGGQQHALDCFRRAAAIDPGYALAWAGVADVHWSMLLYAAIPAPEGLEGAQRAVERALSIDPALPEIQVTQGAIAMCRRDWSGSEQHFLRAIDLNPNDWVAPAYLSLVYALQLRVEEAERYANRAVFLEPESHHAWAIASLAHVFVGNGAAAVEYASSGVDLDEDSMVSYMVRGLGWTVQGEHDNAIRDLRRAVDLSNRMAAVVGFLAFGLGAAGRADDATALAGELHRRESVEYVAPGCFFLAYADADPERAREAQRREIEGGGIAWCSVLKRERFPELVEGIGLPVVPA